MKSKMETVRNILRTVEATRKAISVTVSPVTPRQKPQEVSKYTQRTMALPIPKK